LEEKKLIRFINGRSSLQERREISHWLDQSGSDSEAEKILLRQWEMSTMDSTVGEQEYGRILKKIHGVISPEQKDFAARKSFTLWKMSKWAASILLIVFSGFLLFQTLTPLIQEHQARETASKKFIRSTKAGEKLKIILPDKSTVVLNSLSQLSFYSDYGENERIVYLEGEAYFNIESNPDKPFKVLSGGVITTALGTSFNTFCRNGEIVVSLVEGKVSVTQNSREVVLDPGLQALFSPNKDEGFRTEKFDPEKATAWKEGKIRFKSRPLKEILDKLEDWYGVSIRVEGKVDDTRKVTGLFDNESLDNLLQGLSFSLGLKYVIKGTQVTLQTKPPMN
jgi:ferric-dicitrate binding protein FerR (iron transport regulator)